MSEKNARQLFDEAQRFNSELNNAGWSASETVSTIGTKSPVDLFLSEERPLVVGLFGGTGVGKSSLLNRLAGADIARTGVVRPTSMEITAYLHTDVQLDGLPAHFAADRFSENRHSNSQLSDVMWVDMPDFDSDETQNKDQVLAWLPHIDLLIYVVTPERYKDAEGWRMMLDNGYRHAWLFVINQWDKADPIQYSDFTQMLQSTGFKAPEVFRTVCNAAHAEDQFDELVLVIESLAKRNVINHLQERGWIQRISTLQQRLQQETASLVANNSEHMESSFDQRFEEFESASIAHLDAPFKAYSTLFNDKKTGAINTVLKSLTGKSSNTEVAENIASKSDIAALWDNWQEVRMNDFLQQFALAENEHGVPSAVMAQKNDIANTNGSAVIVSHLKASVNSTIEAPGTQWQRLVAKGSSLLKILLPLAALAWVAFRVVNGFIAGAADRTAYVGFDFLVNGLLLAAIGWVIPFMVEKLFVPSMSDSVYRGLHRGLQSGLAELKRQLKVNLTDINQERHRLQTFSAELDQKIEQFLAASVQKSDPQLSRVLMTAADSGQP